MGLSVQATAVCHECRTVIDYKIQLSLKRNPPSIVRKDPMVEPPSLPDLIGFLPASHPSGWQTEVVETDNGRVLDLVCDVCLAKRV